MALITVDKVVEGKWGPQLVVEGKFLSSYDKDFDINRLSPGDKIEVEMATSKKTGKPYVSRVVSQIPRTNVEQAPAAKQSKKVEPVKRANAEPVQGRDFDKEARGKTRCAMFEAALQSPVVAQLALTVDGLDAALELVQKAAEAGFKHVFPEEK